MADDQNLTAFGLDIRSDAPLLFSDSRRHEPTVRPLTITVDKGHTRCLGWPEEAEIVCDERAPKGEVIFRIEAPPAAGYLISGPDYGSHLLSTDGTQLRCA